MPWPKQIATLADGFRRFQETIVERFIAPHGTDRTTLVYWRARILFAILITGLLLGTVVIAGSIGVLIREKAWALAALDLASFLIILTLLLAERIRYETRAMAVLVICYLIGLMVVLKFGLLSGGPAWLFTFTILVAVLLGAKASVWAIMINIFTLIPIALLIKSGRWGDSFPFFPTRPLMISSGFNYFFLNALTAVSVAALVKGILNAFEKEKRLMRDLENERNQLLHTQRELEREVHERRFVEAALTESEKRYRNFIEDAPMAMLTLNLEGEITYGNKKLFEITGYAASDWLNKSFQPIVHADDLPIVSSRMALRHKGEKLTEPAEIRIYHGSGRVLWVQINSESIYETDRAGHKEMVGIQSFLMDITERKTAQQALSESESRYRHLFELESDALFLIEKQTGRILEVNAAASRMYAYPRQTLLRMRNTDLSVDSEDLCEPSRTYGGQDCVRYHCRRDGTRFPVEITVSQLFWKGKEAHIVSVRDITSRLRNEAARARLERDLAYANKMESIGTLAGGIAHDFNNILYIVTGNAELGLENTAPESLPAKYFQEIKEAGFRAAGIVKQLLNFSQKSAATFESVQVVALIREIINFIRSTLPASIDIQCRLPEKDATLYVDRNQLSQLFMNLCTNSAEAMQTKGGAINISVAYETLADHDPVKIADLKPGTYVRIRFEDSGPGIDADKIDRIFDPYYTTRDFGEGAGMGLAVVHGIVQLHQGAIRADNRRQKGAVFTVWLPVSSWDAESPAVDVIDTDAEPRGSAAVLFVDDEIAIVAISEEMLKRMGYQVSAYTDPLSALQQFRATPDAFDLVITDMTMPYMSGVAFAREVMAVRPEIPVILCSGHSSQVNADKATQLGIAGYLAKPLRRAELRRTVHAVLAGK